ncbi:MAG: hypothetical protein P4M08_06670 [Oligoflexia bacterium]|nr:hypothetical protein [Oligoflexia bacterium]
MKLFITEVAVVALLFGAAGAAHADDSRSDFKFELHGFVGASGYVQDTPGFYLNGQGPLLLTNEPSSSGTTTGFDVRQTRLNFSVAGPTILNGATPKGVVEIDFFNLQGPGGYGEVSAVPRLRLAYGEFNWGDTVVHVGQDWELLFVDQPASLGHMAYPVTFYSGSVFWREPGVSVFHTIETGSSKLEVSGQVLKSDWESPTNGGAVANYPNADLGQLSGVPGVEARVKWTDEAKNDAYIAGHWNKVDASHAGGLPVAQTPSRDFSVVVGKVGGQYQLANFTLKGELYTGKNLAPLYGEQGQFLTASDVHESGGWAQLSYQICPEYSAHVLYGTSRSSVSDVQAAGGNRYQSSVYGGMVEYKVGAFAMGPEFYHVVGKQLNGTSSNNTGAADGVLDGNQYMLTAEYFF